MRFYEFESVKNVMELFGNKIDIDTLKTFAVNTSLIKEEIKKEDEAEEKTNNANSDYRGI